MSGALTIPEIRERLHELADLHGLDELHELAEATKRRRPVKVAPPTSRPVTEAVAGAIRVYAATHPTASHMRIAEVFRVNAGRVSEALRGKRG